jgi:hypothetical protein
MAELKSQDIARSDTLVNTPETAASGRASTAASSKPPSGLEATAAPPHAQSAAKAAAASDPFGDTMAGCPPSFGTPVRLGELAPGTRVDRFVVEERLGAGGMGVVYAARDPELDRRVAIKLLRAIGHNEELRARLYREAQALARVAHPNVVVVHEVGSHDDHVYLAMELVRGTTLRGWLEGAHTTGEILAVPGDAGRGLAAAHAANLIHRDFKPDNVLIGEDGRPRVTDFGLARVASEAVAAARTPCATRPRQSLSNRQLGTRTDPACISAQSRLPHE